MAAAGDGSGHTPLTPEWTPAPRASHYPWQGDRPAAAPSLVMDGGEVEHAPDDSDPDEVEHETDPASRHSGRYKLCDPIWQAT